jgi:hypothetical protein
MAAEVSLRNSSAPPNPLLRLTAVGNNAAMEAEPPNAEPPKRKRRWLQFSLRSLMIGVALLALLFGYVARQHEIVQERQRFLDGSHYTGTNREVADVTWIRRMFGDQGVAVIGLDPSTDKAERQRIADLFPEAWICVVRFPTIPAISMDACDIEYEPFPDGQQAPAWTTR